MSRVENNYLRENENKNTKPKKKKKTVKRKVLPSDNRYLVLLMAMAVVAIGFLTMMAVVNAFPLGMTLTFIIVMLLLIILCGFLFRRERQWLRIVGIVIAALFIIVYGMGIYYLSSTYSMFSRISVADSNPKAKAKNVSVAEESFNIYITGIDMWESEKGYDLERSDVNMIVSICPQTRKILLTSIPRDSYVALHRTGDMDKLTHTGIYGVDETLNTVEDWLGLDMNYYLKMNFSGVVDIINAMDGVEVYSPKAFVPVKRDWWKVEKGWQHMSGKEALAFARERKAFGGKDSERVKNQQRVVKAVIKKMLSSSTLLTKYGDILGAAGDNMETNMSNEEMQALVKMQLADLGDWEIETQAITGKYDMDYVASLTQEEKFLVYKTDVDSVAQCVTNMKKVLEPSAADIAAATATRQKNSMFSFFKGILSKENTEEDEAA